MVSPAAIPARLKRARLRRRSEHRLVAGVAGGIADWLKAPVAFVRFFLAIAWAFAPWMVWVYAGLALSIPARDRNRPDWDNLVGLTRLGVIFLVLELAIPANTYWNQPMNGSAGWWIATYALLAVGGAALLGSDYVRGRPRSPAEVRSDVLAAVPVAASAAAVFLGMLLVTDVAWERYLPLAALVGGAALLVGARRGRPSGLTAPAIVALAVSSLVIASGAHLKGGIGNLRLAPVDPNGERISVRRAVGTVKVDLRRLQGSREPVSLEASVGIGHLRIAVPRGAQVEIDAHVGRGNIEPALGARYRTIQGFDQRLARTYQGRGREPSTRVRVIADVGLGSVEIDEGS